MGNVITSRPTATEDKSALETVKIWFQLKKQYILVQPLLEKMILNTKSIEESQTQCLYWSDSTFFGARLLATLNGKCLFTMLLSPPKFFMVLSPSNQPIARAVYWTNFSWKGYAKSSNFTPLSFIHRANTNELALKQANGAVGSTSVCPDRKIKPLTEILASKRLKLLGHVLRRERQHPLHQVRFASDRAVPRIPNTRRVGRPRKCWMLENMAPAWDILRTQDAHHAQIPFDRNNQHIRDKFIEAACNYQPPFD